MLAYRPSVVVSATSAATFAHTIETTAIVNMAAAGRDDLILGIVSCDTCDQGEGGQNPEGVT